ncbi:MAG: hypothetical protein KDD47_03140 [Acidobacteria bacterium]|nr:hypothetical protein [Acidobacteriota bacterium]
MAVGSPKHVVLVIPRGEAARNFLYSETLDVLSREGRVSVLSVVDDPSFAGRFEEKTERFLPLSEHPTRPLVSRLRTLTENAHDRWLWSEVAKNNWELRDRRAAERGQRGRRLLTKAAARVLGNRPTLRALTRLEQVLHYQLRPTDAFDRLFEEIQPDLVFNGSHIHGMAGELPLRVAHAMGIPTAGFIFSWDNLTSRSRIFVPYDDYLVWHEGMKRQLLGIYPQVGEEHVHVTGTPQFDFHLKSDLELSREELCRQIGVDPARPYVLYTTGISNHFYEEHLHVDLVMRLLKELPLDPKPQLVVRTYVKGTSDEMLALAERGDPDVVFPPVLWEPRWQTPLFEDLKIYSNLLRHAALGINAASTVSLELLLFDKPVINLDFDPPGSDLPWCMGFSRHIYFDHYRPVAGSGAVMVARSEEDMGSMLHRGLTRPEELGPARKAFLERTFGPTLDGHSGRRVAETLLSLAKGRRR